MPRNSQADRLLDFEMLLKAVRDTETELAGVAPFLAALEQAHAQAVSAKARRDGLLASTHAATMEANKALAACGETAISLRHFIRSVLGSRTAKLIRYGIKPRRRGGYVRKAPAGCTLPS